MTEKSVEYAIVIEKSPRNYAAYVPDLPGCVATAATKERIVRVIREAIEFPHRELAEYGGTSPSAADLPCQWQRADAVTNVAALTQADADRLRETAQTQRECSC